MSEKRETPEPTAPVSDAVANNWVDRFAPLWARPYLRLSRADRPVGTWLLLIPCWWGLSLAMLTNPDLVTSDIGWTFIAFAAGAFLMRGAGCTWNDIADRKLDAKVARTKSRPIPSGQVTIRQAVCWMILQCLLSAVVLLSFNGFSIVLGIAALIPVAIYPFAKRFTWWPQVFLGLAFNWGALLGWSVITGSLSIAPITLYAAGIAWTVFYDTIYAYQDIEDDALLGIKSTARLFEHDSRKWLFRFLLLTIILFGTALVIAVQDTLNILSLVIAIMGIWGFALHMFWQMRHLDIESPTACLKLFRSNKEAGLLPVAGMIIAYGIDLVL